eukprot:9413841-Pyramimonas_sp.AAC.1
MCSNKADPARNVPRTFCGNRKRFLEHCGVGLQASQNASPLLETPDRRPPDLGDLLPRVNPDP